MRIGTRQSIGSCNLINQMSEQVDKQKIIADDGSPPEKITGLLEEERIEALPGNCRETRLASLN
jgi:hypothetical protein